MEGLFLSTVKERSDDGASLELLKMIGGRRKALLSTLLSPGQSGLANRWEHQFLICTRLQQSCLLLATDSRPRLSPPAQQQHMSITTSTSDMVPEYFHHNFISITLNTYPEKTIASGPICFCALSICDRVCVSNLVCFCGRSL